MRSPGLRFISSTTSRTMQPGDFEYSLSSAAKREHGLEQVHVRRQISNTCGSVTSSVIPYGRRVAFDDLHRLLGNSSRTSPIQCGIVNFLVASSRHAAVTCAHHAPFVFAPVQVSSARSSRMARQDIGAAGNFLRKASEHEPPTHGAFVVGFSHKTVFINLTDRTTITRLSLPPTHRDYLAGATRAAIYLG